MIWQIIIAIIGNTGLCSLAIFLIQRRDQKKGVLNEIRNDVSELKKQSIKQERDSCRTQMMLLMSDYPEEKGELMRLAEHYFKDLNGDWYMTTLFRTHLKECGIAPPVWFTKAYHTAEDIET